MSDLISRQAAIEALMEILDRPNHAEFLYTDEICRALNHLPSAQPQDIARDIATIIENEKDMRVMLNQQWIPVTDRLPEENKEVLICTDDGLLYIAEHEYLFDRVYWEETTEYRTVENVVAWMLLPEPYKEEQNGKNS